MSNRIPVLVLLGLFVLVQSSAQVHFEGSSYKSAAEKARRLHKSLFVYFYTDWCAPCKQIPKIVFTDPRIRAVIGNQYVSLKLNAEKGEGIRLAKRYGVGGFPTFLYTEADGHELGRTIGTCSNNDYLIAIKSSGRTDPGLDRRKKEEAIRDSSIKQ
jgi:thiol:disulfide interchange protein